MNANKLRLYEAFDKMLKVLDLEAKEVCDRSGVSQSRVSSFRNGKKANMGTNFLDALLDAAQSLDPRAREVFATYIGGKGKPLEEMTLAEKGTLMVSLSKSIQSSISTDSQTTKTT
ncbi:helix-turn-helix domain-containing protein [Myxosarcina sp. GI1(2024)]